MFDPTRDTIPRSETGRERVLPTRVLIAICAENRAGVFSNGGKPQIRSEGDFERGVFPGDGAGLDIGAVDVAGHGVGDVG